MMIKIGTYCSIFFVFFFASCKTLFKKSPYQTYVLALKNTGLDKTSMGKQWLSIGENVLINPNGELKFPFREEIFFRQEKPVAIAYQIPYKKSSKIKFSISSAGQNGVFVDLFESLEAKKSLISEYIKDTSFIYENNRDEIIILRLQPQLLINEHVIVEIVDQPKLGFPVQNGKNADIKSFWGVDRENGLRKHEGIDIFNKRGTPILAVEDGIINNVKITNLGGKVVWQRIGLMGPSIYYAHLDSQLVTEGQRVRKGEVLGLMGNTGNAYSTSPHLHFGIYASGEAIDPIDYVFKKDSVPTKVKSESKYLGEELMVTDKEGVIPINVIAVSTNNITVRDYKGNIFQNDKLNISNQKIKLFADDDMKYFLDEPANNGIAIGKFEPTENYKVLGFVSSFIYLEQKNIKGWVLKK